MYYLEVVLLPLTFRAKPAHNFKTLAPSPTNTFDLTQFDWPLKGDAQTPSWTALIEARGGVVTASVTTRTRVLVAGDGVRRPGCTTRGTGGGASAAQSVSGTAKYRKAKERGLKIITEAELYTLCKSRVRQSRRGYKRKK